MAAKKKYLVGFSGSTIVPRGMKEMVDSFVTKQKGVKRLRKLKTGQRVLEMTEEKALKLAEEQPDLIIEEDEELEMFSPMPGLMPNVPNETELSLNVNVVDQKTKKPVSDVTIYCLGKGVAYKGVTDEKGFADIKIYEPHLTHIIASPRSKYWSTFISSPKLKDNKGLILKLKEIPLSGGYDWGQSYLNIDKVSPLFTGKDVKIAVIDSGIVDHEDLKTAGGYNTLDGQDPTAWHEDTSGHGTHCAGVVAAQQNQIGITGVAPAAEVYSLKVFPGGRLSDLIEAIEWCIDNYIDIISMSLGSRSASLHLETALVEAGERGITCIAAAGNHGGPVSYPAAFETVIAVSAVGQLGSFPEDSAHALKIGEFFADDGETFIANFSNFGPQIDVCSPGVAILSCVPQGYAAWDGTSMACPLIAGLAALILEGYPEIRTGDGRQPHCVREVIAESSMDIGLPTQMQGAGLPNAEMALVAAKQQREYQDGFMTSYLRCLESMLTSAKAYSHHIEQAITKLEAV